MLESGANPNVKERLHGYTPLIEAAIEDQQMVVEALLEFVSIIIPSRFHSFEDFYYDGF